MSRFSSQEIIPLSPRHLTITTIREETCNPFALDMILEFSDIQFLYNALVMCARTAYRDHT